MFALPIPHCKRHGAPMNKIPFDIVGLDLDGTLVDSSQDLAAAVNHTLERAGLPLHSVDEIKRYVGKGTRVMLKRALEASGDYTPERLDALTPILMDYYDANLVTHTRPYPGALAAIAELQTRGIKVAICTNKFDRFTRPILSELGIDHLFASVISGDTTGKAKPDPAPLRAMVEEAGGGRCIFLGDTSNDIDAAKAAGMASIAVSFGFVDATASLGADAILHRFDDLVPLLERWTY
jgi:phosphoglycolate phosphatase